MAPVWDEAPDETLLEQARAEAGAFGAFCRVAQHPLVVAIVGVKAG